MADEAARSPPPATPRELELLALLDEKDDLLAEKDRQLAMAAELGQSLVQKTEALQQQSDSIAASAAHTSSREDESEYRIREVTAQNERLLELLAQSEAEVAELQQHQQQQASPAASPATRSVDGAAEQTAQELRAVADAALGEATALRQQALALDQENAELLEGKLEAEEARAHAERLVRELQEKFGRATAKNATMAEGMVRKELELRAEIEAAQARAEEALAHAEELQASLGGLQNRFATAERRAGEIASAAPRPLPPPLSGAKAPVPTGVDTSGGDDSGDAPLSPSLPGEQTTPDRAVAGSEAARVSPMAEETEPEVDESLGGGGVSLLDDFVAEAAAFRKEAAEAQAEVAALRKRLESVEANRSPRSPASSPRARSPSAATPEAQLQAAFSGQHLEENEEEKPGQEVTALEQEDGNSSPGRASPGSGRAAVSAVCAHKDSIDQVTHPVRRPVLLLRCV
jgi:hypothetical protein|eukprot:COSAG06_NODE_5357_length_3529_cov_2.579883_3_plen_462_part_00